MTAASVVLLGSRFRAASANAPEPPRGTVMIPSPVTVIATATLTHGSPEERDSGGPRSSRRGFTPGGGAQAGCGRVARVALICVVLPRRDAQLSATSTPASDMQLAHLAI